MAEIIQAKKKGVNPSINVKVNKKEVHDTEKEAKMQREQLAKAKKGE